MCNCKKCCKKPCKDPCDDPTIPPCANPYTSCYPYNPCNNICNNPTIPPYSNPYSSCNPYSDPYSYSRKRRPYKPNTKSSDCKCKDEKHTLDDKKNKIQQHHDSDSDSDSDDDCKCTQPIYCNGYLIIKGGKKNCYSYCGYGTNCVFTYDSNNAITTTTTASSCGTTTNSTYPMYQYSCNTIGQQIGTAYVTVNSYISCGRYTISLSTNFKFTNSAGSSTGSISYSCEFISQTASYDMNLLAPCLSCDTYGTGLFAKYAGKIEFSPKVAGSSPAPPATNYIICYLISNKKKDCHK